MLSNNDSTALSGSTHAFTDVRTTSVTKESDIYIWLFIAFSLDAITEDQNSCEEKPTSTATLPECVVSGKETGLLIVL